MASGRDGTNMEKVVYEHSAVVEDAKMRVIAAMRSTCGAGFVNASLPHRMKR